MKGLLHILFITGVVLFGFQSSFANYDGNDKNKLSKDSTGGNKVLCDTVLKNGGVQVGDTLVYEDYEDEDEGGLYVVSPSLITAINPVRNCIIPPKTIEYVKTIDVVNPINDSIKVNKIIQSTNSSIIPELKIYPNPATASSGQQIHIKHNFIGDVTGAVIDQAGKLLQSLQTNSDEIIINAPSAGLYYITIQLGENRVTSRLIVQ